MRVGVYRGPHTNSSDAMTYKNASAGNIEFEFITDASMTVQQVLDRNYDVIDVPDPLYPFTQELIEKHPCVVVTVWENLPWNMLGDHWKRCFAKAALVVCRSPMARQTAIEAAGCDPEKAVVIPAGVDTELFKPAEKKKGMVLYVGRVEWEKGILDLIMAANQQDWQLFIVGDGSMLEYAKRFADILETGNVHFLGKIPHEETRKYYALAEVFAYPNIPTPYWQEQFGISVLEAAASGCKLVLSDQNVFRWFEATLENVYIRTPGDYMALRNGIITALSGHYVYQEPEMVKHYSSEAIGEKIREAYAKLKLAVGV